MAVSGVNTSVKTFMQAVDNLRRNSGATKDQITRMFNQVNA